MPTANRNTREFYYKSYGRNYNNRQNYDKRANDKGSNRQGGRYIEPNIDNIVDLVMRRLDNTNEDRTRQPPHLRTYQPTRENLPAFQSERSENPDFQNMWKTLFKVIQIEYHLHNWTKLPGSINRDLTYLAGNIRPPDPIDSLSKDITDILTNAGELIRQLVQTHLHTRLDANRALLRSMRPLDKARAIEVAQKHLARRLGNKITNLREQLNAEAQHIGSQTSTADVFIADQSSADTSPPAALPVAKRLRVSDTPPSTIRPPPSVTPPDLPVNTNMDTSSVRTPVPTLPTSTTQVTVPTTTAKPSRITAIKNKVQPIEILSDTTTVIISDGSLLNASEVDLYPGWQLIALPGCELNTIAIKAAHITTYHKVKVIIAAGLHHRGGSYHEDTDATLHYVASRIKQGHRIFFLGHSIDANLKTDEQNNIINFNKKLEEMFEDNFIHPCPPELTHSTTDLLRYDTSTVKYTLRFILAFMNEMMP